MHSSRTPRSLAVITLCLLSFLPFSAAAQTVPESPSQADHERMAAQHQHDHPAPSPAAQAAPAAAVDQESVVYATVAGKAVSGFLARPQGSSGGKPAVIVIHEWWGLNDNIRQMARRLAGEGYSALAVDLYEGEIAGTPEEARALMGAALGRISALEDHLRQAYSYLETTQKAPRVGTIGWCFGGGWSLAAALLLPDKIDATVIYYGRLETDPAKLRPLTMPILGIFGELDQGIPVESVRAFEAALAAEGKAAQIHLYPGADHAFANASGGRYKADAAEDAWARTVAFFAKHLR